MLSSVAQSRFNITCGGRNRHRLSLVRSVQRLIHIQLLIRILLYVYTRINNQSRFLSYTQYITEGLTLVGCGSLFLIDPDFRNKRNIHWFFLSWANSSYKYSMFHVWVWQMTCLAFHVLSGCFSPLRVSYRYLSLLAIPCTLRLFFSLFGFLFVIFHYWPSTQACSMGPSKLSKLFPPIWLYKGESSPPNYQCSCIFQNYQLCLGSELNYLSHDAGCILQAWNDTHCLQYERKCQKHMPVNHHTLKLNTLGNSTEGSSCRVHGMWIWLFFSFLFFFPLRKGRSLVLNLRPPASSYEWGLSLTACYSCLLLVCVC